MALVNLSLQEVSARRLEGYFETDGVALPATTGTIAAPAAPTSNIVIDVASVDGIAVGDLVAIAGIGPGATELVAGVVVVPTSTQINIQGTRVSTAISSQAVTLLPALNIKHNAKRARLVNLTSGDSWEWLSNMGYGAALKRASSGAQSFTASQGFYARGGVLYLHPSMYSINSKYALSVDF